MSKKISEIRSSEIIQAMYNAIERDGISLPSFERLAAGGDLTRQLVRHYFSSSEEIALGLCDALAAVYKDCLLRGILTATDSERLNVFLDFYFNLLADKDLSKPEDDVVYDALMAFASTSDKVQKNLRDQYTLLQMTLAHEIQISYPALSQDHCRELGYLVVVTMYGHWKMVASLGFDESYNVVSRAAIDRLIESYTSTLNSA